MPDRLRKHFLPLLFLSLTIVVLFWKLFTLDQAFLSGDHREQQYPWASFYQEQIQSGHLPWWTTHIHAGFPILAEGQIGAFYPINFLTFYFLPTKIAYNYGILLHYFLAALFCYALLQKLGRSVWASAFATLIFLYGSSQGGYFYYNYISQKVVIWLPLALILIERIFEKHRWQDAFFLSLVFAAEIFGGYLQVAIYTLFYTGLYFILRWLYRPEKGKSFALFTSACVLGILISLVQLLPTLELALFSSRANAPKAIAYIGSMNPFGFMTLLYPSWDGFLASEWYIGILGLFFFCWSWKRFKDPYAKPFFILAGLFLLLALGEWSPLYRLIIETTGFSSFRTPIKFLFFVTFSMTVLAAYGWDEFWAIFPRSAKGVPTRWFLVTVLAAILVPVLIQQGLEISKPKLLPQFEKFVVKKFHGQPGHPHSEEDYRKNARSFYGAIQSQVDVFKDKDTRIEWSLLLAALLMLAFSASGKVPQKGMRLGMIAFLLLDLYFYGFTSIKPNLESFKTIDNPEMESPVISHLKQDPSLFRMTELFTAEAQEKRFPIFPSLNMVYGIDDLGAYSPLVMKPYKEFLEGWGGYINDSLSATPVQKEKMLAGLPKLQTLNTKYLLSREAMESSLLKERVRDQGMILYELENPLPRAFFSTSLPAQIEQASANGQAKVSVEDYGQQKVEIKINAQEKGYLLLTDIHYPGWTASVDGKSEAILRWGKIFRAVEIQPGLHTVYFNYKPARFFNAELLALVLTVSGLLAAAISALRKTS